MVLETKAEAVENSCERLSKEMKEDNQRLSTQMDKRFEKMDKLSEKIGIHIFKSFVHLGIRKFVDLGIHFFRKFVDLDG